MTVLKDSSSTYGIFFPKIKCVKHKAENFVWFDASRLTKFAGRLKLKMLFKKARRRG